MKALDCLFRFNGTIVCSLLTVLFGVEIGCAEQGTQTQPGHPEIGAQLLTLPFPGDFPSLQATVDAADPGDEILLEPGVYDEAIALKDGVHLVGAGIGETILTGHIVVNGGGSVSGITLDGQGAAGPGLQGTGDGFLLTFSEVRGWATGSAIVTAGQPVRYLATTFRNNDVAIDVTDAGSVEVFSSVFAFNSGGAIQCNYEASPSVAGCTLIANATAESEAQIALDHVTCAGEIRETIVVNGSTGIRCTGCSTSFSHNNVWGNSGNYSGVSASGSDISLDPGFANVGEDDFRLSDGSPCVDAGGTSTEPSQDRDGEPRPQGASHDVGAFEWGVSSVAIRITEVMSNPLVESTGEYVELLNIGADTVDLTALALSDGDKLDPIVSLGGGAAPLAPGAYAVVIDPDYPGGYDIPSSAVLVTVGDAALGNGVAVNDPIRLYEANGTTLIDAFTHPFNAGNGVAVERVGPDAPDAPTAWKPSPCTASPGTDNCLWDAPPTQLVITEVMSNPEVESTGEFVEILNVGVVPIDLAGYQINDGDQADTLVAVDGGFSKVSPGSYALIVDPDFNADFTIPEDTAVLTASSGAAIGNGLAVNDPISVLEASGAAVVATYSHPVAAPNGISVELVVVSAGDAPGNWAPSPCESGSSPGLGSCAVIPAVPDLPTLALSEVMANPIDEDTGEFVEIYNHGTDPVDVAGLVLDDSDGYDVLAGWDGGSTVIPAKGYGVILDPEYAGEYSIPSGAVLLTVASTTALGTGIAVNDKVRLLLDDGVTAIDTYLNPFNPGNGVAAERKDVLAGDVAGNWVASSCPSGSSPGGFGCVLQEETPPVAVINEIMANALEEDSEEYVELHNPTGTPVELSGLLLDDGSDTDVLQPWQAGGATALPPFGYGLVLDSSFQPGVPTFFVDDTFDDGNPTTAPWIAYSWPEGVGSVWEAEGELRGIIDQGEMAVGVAVETAENYPARGIRFQAEMTLPVTGGEELSAYLQLASETTGDQTQMGAYIYARFVAQGSNRNVELWLRAPGNPPQKVWSWQPGPFCCPKATQRLRIELDRTHYALYHGNDYDYLFHSGLHGFDVNAFSEVHGLLTARMDADPDAPLLVTFQEAKMWREPYDIPDDAVLFTTDDEGLGDGLDPGDSLALKKNEASTLAQTYSYPVGTAPGIPVERTDPTAPDAPGTWQEATCGPTPGRVNCAATATYVATWIDTDYSESGHDWWRAIGYPSFFSPDNLELSCELVTVCPGSGSGLTYQDNIAAADGFSFTNPYSDSSIRFVERSGPTDPCFDPCPNASLVVGPGETTTVPASSLGYYFAETTKQLNGMDYDFSFYWNPPPDPLMPPFQVEVK